VSTEKRSVDSITVTDNQRPLDQEQVANIAKSMDETGTWTPIFVRPSGELVAGQHRLAAAKQLGWTEVDCTIFHGDDLEARLLTINENLRRYDLSVLVQAQHIIEREEILEELGQRAQRGENQYTQKESGRASDALPPKTTTDLATEMGLGRRSYNNRKQIGKNLDKKTQDVLLNTPIANSTDQLLALAKMDEPQRDRVVAEIADGAVSLREAQSNLQKAQEQERLTNIPVTPDGDQLYRCIVIDPPWPMRKILRDTVPKQDVFPYKTMTLDAIKDIDIASLADPDGCHVYLWTTQKFLPNSFDIMQEWGVNYQCLMTWTKPTGFTPFSWMYNTEHVLFGTIGNLAVQRKGLKIGFDAPVVGHSVKPQVFFDRVEQASPEPRLEMFARTKRDGWDSWGDETDK